MAVLELICDGVMYTLYGWNSHDLSRQVAITQQCLGRSPNVRLALIGPKGTQPKQEVVVKMARGRLAVEALSQEVHLYASQLRDLQGSVVPILYNFYQAKDRGHDIACMFMEYCLPVPDVRLHDQNREIMVAVCKLHQAGVVHRQLDDGHHIVKTGLGVRIVDFSLALGCHPCPGASPMLTHSSTSLAMRDGCPELVLMEKIYGLMDLLPPQSPPRRPQGFANANSRF